MPHSTSLKVWILFQWESPWDMNHMTTGIHFNIIHQDFIFKIYQHIKTKKVIKCQTESSAN